MPLSYKLGDSLSIEWYNYINIEQGSYNNQIKNTSPFKIILNDKVQIVDIFCRQLVNNTKQKLVFFNQGTSTILFSSQIYYSENQQNKDKDELFHKESRSSQSKKQRKSNIEFESKESERENNQRIFNLKTIKNVMRIYEDAIDSNGQKKTLNTLDFSYLTLVSIAYQNQCLSLLKILNTHINSSVQLGWKDQQKIETLFSCANAQIDIENKNNKKENNHQFQIHKILELQQTIKQINRKYFICLRQYQIVIQKLSMNFIDINDAFLLMNQYREQRNQLQNLLVQQLQINNNNETLKDLCIRFDFYLLHKQYLSAYCEKINRQRSFQQKYTEFQSEQSCLAFISLLENQFGIVKNANKWFIKTLGYTSKSQVIGKPIFQIFPQKLLQKGLYSKIISQITENYIRKYNEIVEIPLFIARNNQGYSKPFQVKIQSQMIDSQDFGLAIWAQPINDDNIYLVLDYKDPSKIKLMSRKFKKLFLKNIDSQNLKMMRMDSFVPIVNDLIKISENQQNKKFETLLIKYEMSTEALMKVNLQYPNFLNSLMDSQIFVITVSFQIFKTKIASFINMVIESYSPLKSFSSKIHHIKQYQTQIKELCDINLKFDLDYQKENILKQQNFLLNSEYLIGDTETNLFRQKFDNSEHESTTTNLQNLLQTSVYYNLSQRNQDIVSTIEQQSSLSPRRFIDNTLQHYPQQSERDSILNQQSPQIQNSVQHSKFYTQKMNDSKCILDCSKEASPQNNQRGLIDFSQTINKLKRFDDQSKLEINQQSKINQSEDQFQDFSINQTHRRANTLEFYNNNQISFTPKQKQIQQDQNNIENSNQQLLQNKMPQQSKQPALKQHLQQKDAKNKRKIKELFPTQEKQIQQNQDAQSVSSSVKSAQDKLLFDMIYQKRQIKSLKFVNMLGIISLLVIVTITLYEFLQFYFSLSSQKENFKFINWIYMINIQLSYALSERNIILLNINNLLSTPAAQNQPFLQLLKEQNDSRINLSKQYLLLLYNNTNPNIQVFNIIQNEYILQNIYFNKTYYSSYKMSMLYSVVMQTYGIYYFVSNKDPTGVIKQQNEANYQALNDQVQTIFSEMNDAYVNQLNQIQNQSTFQLYATIFISFFCLLTVIPSYVLIKVKQQKILELFATLDRQNLQEILKDLNYQLSFCKGFNDKNELLESKSSLESQGALNKTNKIMQNAPILIEKKLNISRTSHLKYSLKYLVLGLVSIFCLITVYPIVNYLLINQFVANSTIIYDFNNVVCQTYFFILNSLRGRQGLATAFLLPSQQSVSINTFQKILSSMMTNANQLPDLIQANIGKISSTNILNKDIFNNYLVNVYTGNTCDIISNYTQYQNGDFLYNQCTTVGKGSLLKGLLNGVLFFISIYKDYMTFAMSQNATQFQQSFNKYNKNVLAIKQFQFKIELSKDHEYLLNFFQDQNSQLYNYYENISTIILIISTKRLLDIFPRQAILKNTYIMSYLRQNE
ncbi:transmembrane protein, putative (macronuclear) [Tetrahymena thermophila SB210]|uniref:Transmembrane protein, putative n=1 Tax=Tetrahymena thermophila (strain SB210) TaxID=312017 RepID=X1W3N1_TETTS|nr:transmembrane protein, putative [Tetrahymena thermophila SB210]EAR87615.3 transmembrane protein, putative [Tetrahymena thermophila SB210]|eukprot:XP_001007860.3 transmembrane protein, putative [Tetrahymena thermophila SB210]